MERLLLSSPVHPRVTKFYVLGVYKCHTVSRVWEPWHFPSFVLFASVSVAITFPVLSPIARRCWNWSRKYHFKYSSFRSKKKTVFDAKSWKPVKKDMNLPWNVPKWVLMPSSPAKTSPGSLKCNVQRKKYGLEQERNAMGKVLDARTAKTCLSDKIYQ